MNSLKKGYEAFVRKRFRKQQVNNKYVNLGFDKISYVVWLILIIILIIFVYAYFKTK